VDCLAYVDSRLRILIDCSELRLGLTLYRPWLSRYFPLCTRLAPSPSPRSTDVPLVQGASFLCWSKVRTFTVRPFCPWRRESKSSAAPLFLGLFVLLGCKVHCLLVDGDALGSSRFVTSFKTPHNSFYSSYDVTDDKIIASELVFRF